MSIYFINSTNRLYEDRDLNKIYELLFTDGGVFNLLELTILDWQADGDFFTKINTGLDIKVNPGLACKNIVVRTETETCLVEVKTETDLTVSSNASGDIRVDSVILRIDQEVIDNDTIDVTGSNVVTVEIVEGTGTSPLTDGEISTAIGGDEFVRLSDIYVPDGAVSLVQNDITDTRVYAQTSNNFQFGGERYRFIGLITDPANPQTGDLWFSITDNALKLKTDTDILSFTSTGFDIYSDGVAIDNTQASDIISNITPDGNQYAASVIELNGGTDRIGIEWWQVFTAPIAALGSVYLKKGQNLDDLNRSVKIAIYTADVSDEIDTLVEEFDFSIAEWNALDEFSYFELKLSGSYTMGNKYGVLFTIDSNGVTDDPAILLGAENNDANVTDLQIHNRLILGSLPGAEYSTYLDRSLDMRISTRETVDLGTTTDQKIGQTFISESSSIRGINFRKGDDNGTPTGTVTFELFASDVTNEPVGDALQTIVYSEEEWDAIAVDEIFNVPISTVLGIGLKYMFVVSTENLSGVNYRELWYASQSDGYSAGQGRTYNGSIWADKDYDLWFQIIEGAENKIVKTKADGKIADELFPDNLVQMQSQALEYYSTWQTNLENVKSRVAVSKSGKYLALYSGNATTPNSYISIFEKVGQLYRVINRFTATGHTNEAKYVIFSDDETRMYISMGNTGTDQARIWDVDFLDPLTTVDYADGLHVYSQAYTSIDNAIFEHEGFIYMAYSTEDYRKIDIATWTLDSSITNTGLNIRRDILATSKDKAGNIVTSLGDVWSFDGTTHTKIFDLDIDGINIVYWGFAGSGEGARFAYSGIGNLFLLVVPVGLAISSATLNQTQIRIETMEFPEY